MIKIIFLGALILFTFNIKTENHDSIKEVRNFLIDKFIIEARIDIQKTQSQIIALEEQKRLIIKDPDNTLKQEIEKKQKNLEIIKGNYIQFIYIKNLRKQK